MALPVYYHYILSRRPYQGGLGTAVLILGACPGLSVSDYWLQVVVLFVKLCHISLWWHRAEQATEAQTCDGGGSGGGGRHGEGCGRHRGG